MKTYKITLVDQNQNNIVSFDCKDTDYILTSAEKYNIELPYSCRAGSCSTCVGKIMQGAIDQRDQTFLEKNQLEKGFALLCVAYPCSDLVISINEEENLY